MHGYSVAALQITQQQNHPSSMHATITALTFSYMRALQNVQKILFSKVEGKNKLNRSPKCLWY